jgi:peroxiredoxin
VPPDGEAAPDFTLALGDGGTFTLSDEQKPVYMIFWAEW